MRWEHRTNDDNVFEGCDFKAIVIPDQYSCARHEAFIDCGNLFYLSDMSGIMIGADTLDRWNILKRETSVRTIKEHQWKTNKGGVNQ